MINKNKLEAKVKKETDISESFEAPDGSSKEKIRKTQISERESVATKEIHGRGMQLGKPKKIEGANKLSQGFGFDEDKSSFFTPKEEEKTEEQEDVKASKNIEMVISESAN